MSRPSASHPPPPTAELPAGAGRWLRRLADVSRPGAPTCGQRLRLLLAWLLLRLVAALHPLPGRRRVWREGARCIGEFRVFRRAGGEAAGGGGAAELARRVGELRRRHPVGGPWAAEGLAFEWPSEAWPPSRDGWSTLPAGALVPLHAGLGQALARRHLTPPAAGAAAVDRLLAAVAARGAPGCGGVSLEAAGFFVRVAAPAALGVVDGALRRQGAACPRRLLFWHGVGRALYFLFPRLGAEGGGWSDGRSGWPGWRRAAREAPAAVRGAARSGFVFAIVLSQLDAALLATFLHRHGGGGLDAAPFVHGLTGAAVVHRTWAGPRHRLAPFLAPRPAPGWQELVTSPVEHALGEAAPRLAAGRRFDELFLLPASPRAPAADLDRPGALPGARR